MDSVYRQWVGGREVGVVGVGGKLKAGYTFHGHIERYCVFSKTQKQPQCTCQAETVAGNSLTPHAILLVCPSGTRYSTLDHHEFIGLEKCCL